ncbi:xanthine dehydrogenase family protein subunit M [Oscillochloris sp. ZM17-4]|uniref:FAD binding domain-containing protein n=1 Tax=Oscillochloris sp. ZM17-4 TaxID=2866714 RepID=UPI001C72AF18|nr:xanthine dehydrogenase family protein subunit M [Oscillochloris sp. ZM17-4]MBX0328914.1 xanthine dehydrogenase family protein subunit M [Oscillochloris sp. ZM17-4]
MIPSAFEYATPATLNEAMAMLAADEDAKLLAGGHSLLPTMKLRLAAPTKLIDLRKIGELRGVSASGGGARIGAMTTYAEATASAALKGYAALIDATSIIGDTQVRNRGTIGGAMAHGDPAADLPAVMLALGATVNVIGSAGSRAIAIDDFFVGMLTTALEEGEIITSIDLPALAAGTSTAYVKFANPASGYAMVGVAASVTMSGGKVSACRIGLTGAGPSATRLEGVEQALTGSDGSEASIASAVANAGDGLDILGDIHAGEDYRRAMVSVYAKRAIVAAIARA